MKVDMPFVDMKVKLTVVQGSNLIRRKKHRHYGESVCMWKERKILTAISIIHLQPILKEKREGAPEWNFYRLRKWIMGRVAWIKTDQFLRWQLVFFFVSFSARSWSRSRSREKEKQVKRWKRNARRSTVREREKRRVRKRRRKVKEERKEGSGVARDPQEL